jgi:hypothetical protein
MEGEVKMEINRKLGEVALACLLIGGHSVSTALLAHKLSDAIRGALTVAVCILIFSLAERIAKQF